MTSRIVIVLVLLGLLLPQNCLAEAAKPSSVILLEGFWRDVWAAKNPDAVDKYVTEDFVITSGGKDIRTRAAFKTWLADFQSKISDMDFKVLETFQNEDGSRVVSRLKVTGKNNGLFGLPPDQKPFVLTATAIWEVTPDGRLAHNWVERNGLEIYRQLTE
ncbi:MAG: ester cyclase [Methyloceanibacter sp.]